MNKKILGIVPVLPSSDLERDINWYDKHVGFKLIYKEEGYAVLKKIGAFNSLTMAC